MNPTKIKLYPAKIGLDSTKIRFEISGAATGKIEIGTAPDKDGIPDMEHFYPFYATSENAEKFRRIFDD